MRLAQNDLAQKPGYRQIPTVENVVVDVDRPHRALRHDNLGLAAGGQRHCRAGGSQEKNFSSGIHSSHSIALVFNNLSLREQAPAVILRRKTRKGGA